MNFFTDNPLWHLISQADIISKLVLLTLLGMSILCWAIFFGKLIIFRLKNNQFKKANKQLTKINTVPELVTFANSIKNTAPGYFLLKNINFFKDLVKGDLTKEINKHDWYLIYTQYILFHHFH